MATANGTSGLMEIPVVDSPTRVLSASAGYPLPPAQNELSRNETAVGTISLPVYVSDCVSNMGAIREQFKHKYWPSGITGLLDIGIQTSSISGGLGSWLSTGVGKRQPESTTKRWIVWRILVARGFKLLMAFLILLHIGLAIKETDLRANGDQLPTGVAVLNFSLIGFYVVEITMRIYVHRHSFFRSFSNWFDLIIVLADIFSVFTRLTNLSSVSPGTSPSISFLRVLRLGRILRVFRVFVLFRELSMLIHGLTSASRAILWGIVMIILVLIVWCILSVEWIHPVILELYEEDETAFDDCSRCPRAFSSVFQAMLTYAQTIIAGDSWGKLAIPVIEREPHLAIIFMGTYICVQLGLLNLILAVIVDRAQEARQEDVELVLSEKAERFKREKVRLLRMCMQLDVDKTGYLTLNELLNGFDEYEEFADLLRFINITKQEMQLFYHVLDVDHSGEVSYKEFVEQLYMMKTHETKTLMLYSMSSLRREVNEQIDSLKKWLSRHQENRTISGLQNSSKSGLSGNPAVVIKDTSVSDTKSLQLYTSELLTSVKEISGQNCQDQLYEYRSEDSATKHAKQKFILEDEFKKLQARIDDGLKVSLANLASRLQSPSALEVPSNNLAPSDTRGITFQVARDRSSDVVGKSSTQSSTASQAGIENSSLEKHGRMHI